MQVRFAPRNGRIWMEATPSALCQKETWHRSNDGPSAPCSTQPSRAVSLRCRWAVRQYASSSRILFSHPAQCPRKLANTLQVGEIVHERDDPLSTFIANNRCREVRELPLQG